MAAESGSEKAKPPADAMTNGVNSGDHTLSRGIRDLAGRLRLGKGGQKAKRGSTPRNSLPGDRALSRGSSSVSSRSVSDASLGNLSDRLRRLHEDGPERLIPFRIKFVNSMGDATMADVYPYEDYREIIQRIAPKLRMDPKIEYVLLYKDTDDEEIGVACTDNLREMFAIFEPGSRLQLRIAPFQINNSGALDSIAKIWDISQTPNVFISEDEAASEVSADDVNLSDIKLATEKPEMAERPQLGSQHMAVEDIADTAVAAAAATAAANAAAAATAAPTATTEEQPSSTKPEPATSKTSSASSAATSKKPTAPGTPASARHRDAEELRQAIMLMSTNLTLAIDSLGSKLTRNFDKLSDEQAKILETLKQAAEKQKQKEEVVVTTSEAVKTKDEGKTTTTTTTTTTTVDKKEEEDEKVSVEVEKQDEKVDVDVEVDNKEEKIKVDIEAEKKDEKVDVDVEVEKTDDKIDVDVEVEKTDEKIDVDVEVEKKDDKIEVDVEIKKDDEAKKDEKKDERIEVDVKLDEAAKKEEVVQVEIVDDAPPSPPRPPTPPLQAPTPPTPPMQAPTPPKAETVKVKVEQAPAPPKTETVKVKVEQVPVQHGAEVFRSHLVAANFAFHSNPYSSSFFQRGFAETGMPGHFARPCMMASPFECPCGHAPCSHCLSTL
ncbi:hypothetical protein H4S01_000187 [Coemansia sp. RSA 2610]|nr:hypothetical protein H4S01_000187 [Coemansia sp. RSA 2610]